MNPLFATEISLLAREHGAVNLGQGFPDGPGPQDVRAVAAEAVLNGPNQYPPMTGLPALREAVADATLDEAAARRARARKTMTCAVTDRRLSGPGRRVSSRAVGDDHAMITRAACALAAALLLAAGPAPQAFAAPQPVGPAAQSFRLGQLKLVALRDALNVLPNDGKVFGVADGPAPVAAVLAAAGAPADKITLGVDALLAEGGGRVMLFDTGLGPGVHGALPASLALAGVPPAAVTDVFITHSHGDHVGGLVTAQGGLAFPNAVIHMSAVEWAWMQAQPKAAALAAAITAQVRPFEPGATIVPGVSAVALPGHTPGHTGYEIVSGSEHLFDMGDLAHSAIVSLARPDWAIGYDADKAEGEATRRATLAKLAASRERVFAPHFPFPGVGRIEAAGAGFTWKPGLP